jgi:hypothetical protein
MSISEENEPLSRVEKKRIYARERARRLRRENPELMTQKAREWREKNRERSNEQANRSHLKRYWADPEAARARNSAAARRRYAADPEKSLVRYRAWKAANPEKARLIDANCKTKKAYGITIAERDAMLAAQEGCAVCGVDKPGSKKGWHIDHCHDTKKVRGILCHHCNVAAGSAKDDPVRLRAIADYLERHRACESK